MLKKADFLITAIFILFGFCFFGSCAFAMSSTNYMIGWDSINNGGLDNSSSSNYSLRDSLGEQATGFSSSTDFVMSSGYRTGDQASNVLSFQLGTQENSTEIAYTSYNTTTKQVVLSSASGYSAGDLIEVVENKGLTENIAVGKIVSVIGNTVTVEKWDGNQDAIGAIPAGGDDFAYRMNGNASQFGTLSPTSGVTSVTVSRVTSDAQNGYTVYVSDDGDLRDMASGSIANVSDGQVTIGSEEYGWRVFGDKAVNFGSDFAFATSTRAIQSSAAKTTDVESVGLIYKVAISPLTPAGSYGHVVRYTITANY